MDEDGPTWRADVEVAVWIAPRLGVRIGRVGAVVPTGFEAYARVLHPVPGASDRGGTWAEVCRFTGRRTHALMQWHAVAGVPLVGAPPVGSVRWPGGHPELGNLRTPSLEVLCGVLAGHTSADANCFFALWDGHGWIHGGMAVISATDDSEADLDPGSGSVPPAYPREIIDGPRLRHPFRDYILFSGPLSRATHLGCDPWRQSPNLFWPDDRSWCVATEIDFDSTLVAGTAAVVDAVLAAPALEVWPVGPDDALTVDGDTVNI